MVVLLVAGIGLIVAAALAFWPARGDDESRSRPEPAGPPASLEGVLANQLITGDISRYQYLRALEQIAAREERRRSLPLPWDESPGTRP